MEAFPKAKMVAWCRGAFRSRRSRWIVGAGALALVLAGYLAHQTRLTNEALVRASAAERAAERASAAARGDRIAPGSSAATRDAMVRRASARSKSAAKRTRQLYEELDALMNAKNYIERDLEAARRKTEEARARVSHTIEREGKGAGGEHAKAPASAPPPLPPFFAPTLPEPLAVPR